MPRCHTLSLLNYLLFSKRYFWLFFYFYHFNLFIYLFILYRDFLKWMTSYSNVVKIFFFLVFLKMLVYFFHVTLSANQNAYSYRISGKGGISVLYNKIIKRSDYATVFVCLQTDITLQFITLEFHLLYHDTNNWSYPD